MLNRIVLPVLLITLTSCSSDSDNATINQIPEDFNLFKQTGTWQLSGDLNSVISLPSNVVDSFLLTADIQLLSVASINVDGNNVTLSDCDALAPETIQASELEAEIKDDLLDDGLECSVDTLEYTKISDSNYIISYICDESYDFTIEYNKLDDTGDYNFGNLAFLYDLGDLNATTGVCGTINNEHIVTVVTPQPNSAGFENTDETYQSFTVVAPYNGERIEIDFLFTRNITVDSYTVALDAELSNDVVVDIEVTSIPFLDTAETGVVNITAVSQYSITGDFAFVTSDGNDMSGNFSFDIE